MNVRTRIKRLVCRTICFAKTERLHDLVIGLFVHRYEFGRTIEHEIHNSETPAVSQAITDENMTITQADITGYYHRSQIYYRLFWRLSRHLSLHYGFYDDNSQTHNAAVINMIRVLATMADRLNKRTFSPRAGTGCARGVGEPTADRAPPDAC